MLGFLYYHYRACAAVGFLALFGASLCWDLHPLFYFFGGLYFVLIHLLASRYSDQATKAYTENCDPEPYLEMGLLGVRRFQKARSARGRDSLANSHIYAATGLAALGRYEEALEHLDAIDRSALSPYSRFIYWHDRFSIFLRLDQPPAELARLLDLAQDSLKDAKFPSSLRNMAEQSLKYDRFLLHIREEGPSWVAAVQLRQGLSLATTELERVHGHYTLSDLLLALGDTSTAREHLNYVIAHGNKLYARTQAQELLDKLNAEEAPSL